MGGNNIGLTPNESLSLELFWSPELHPGGSESLSLPIRRSLHGKGNYYPSPTDLIRTPADVGRVLQNLAGWQT